MEEWEEGPDWGGWLLGVCVRKIADFSAASKLSIWKAALMGTVLKLVRKRTKRTFPARYVSGVRDRNNDGNDSIHDTFLSFDIFLDLWEDSIVFWFLTVLNISSVLLLELPTHAQSLRHFPYTPHLDTPTTTAVFLTMIQKGRPTSIPTQLDDLIEKTFCRKAKRKIVEC